MLSEYARIMRAIITQGLLLNRKTKKVLHSSECSTLLLVAKTFASRLAADYLKAMRSAAQADKLIRD